MARIANIIMRARDSLSDPDESRWSNGRLLRLLDEGQKLLALHARTVRSTATVLIDDTNTVYNLPKAAYLLTRVIQMDGKVLPLKTHDEMDRFDPLWERRKSDEIQYIIIDKLKANSFKVYPALKEDKALELFVHYVAVPGEIHSLTQKDDEMSVPLAFDVALKHYIVGHALRDDRDTQNRTVGADELKMFSREVAQAKIASSADYLQTNTFKTFYNPGGFYE